MPREPVEPIDESARGVIWTALRRRNLNRSKLAQLAGVNRSTISRILAGQRGATVTTLTRIADVLGIPKDKLMVQYQLDFEIDQRFVEMAQETLREELARLRAEVGVVRATRITGSVGVRFHGISHEERVFERVFALQIPAQMPQTRAAG